MQLMEDLRHNTRCWLVCATFANNLSSGAKVSKHFVSEASTELHYIERPLHSKDLYAQLTSNFELGRNDIPMFNFFFCLLSGGGVQEALHTGDIRRVSSEQIVSTSDDVSQALTELAHIDGVDISGRANSLSCIEMSSIAGAFENCSIMDSGDIGVIKLRAFMGICKSLRPGKIFGCCIP